MQDEYPFKPDNPASLLRATPWFVLAVRTAKTKKATKPFLESKIQKSLRG
jgi:hypothetical protein